MIAEVKEISQEINMETRPPVVVVMGHVDHGKTTLLDFIRQTKVAEKEAGGITQHIGAYSIDAPAKITFIDTPGHEAFREMRSRGASVADVGILVVAADEGVKPQTKEAIQILQSAGIPFLIAINKIDRPGKDVERVKKELADNGALVESWSGKIPSVEVSAKTGEGVDDLLELVALMTEMEQLHGSREGGVEGVVIESHRDPQRGATATVLIRNGSLARGQFMVIDGAASLVKTLENFRGLPIQAAGLSDPVRVTGLVAVPAVGSEARSFNEKREAETYAAATKKEPARTRHEETEGKSYINVILKADVSGSKEAIEGVLKEMQLPDIGVRILRSEVGEINDSDMQLALAATNATVLAFKVKVPPHLADIAEKKSIPVIKAEIIYEMFDEFKKTIARLIPAEIRQVAAGKLKVLKFFDQPKSKQIIGGRVIEGKLVPGLLFRVMRKDAALGKGKIFGLQERKTPVQEVPEGSECGLLVEADMLIAENDILEAFSEERIERTL